MLKICSPADISNLAPLVLTFSDSDSLNETNIKNVSTYLERVFAQKLITILGCKHEGQLIGYASIVVYPSIADPETNAYVDELFIHPDYQYQGHGSKFLTEVKEWCRGQGVKKLKLLTRSDNVRAQAFYEKNLGIKKDKINYTFEIN